MDSLFDAVEVLLHAAGAAVRPIRRVSSSVQVTRTDVRIHNAPWLPRHFALDRVDRFDWTPSRDGQTCVLLLNDNSVVPVHAVSDDHPGAATALNNSIVAARERRGD